MTESTERRLGAGARIALGAVRTGEKSVVVARPAPGAARIGGKCVVVALPLAYSEGQAEYNGIMRHLRDTGAEWDLRIVRHSFGASIFDGFAVSGVAGVICGTDERQSLTNPVQVFPEEMFAFCARRRIPLVCIDCPCAKRPLPRSARRAFIAIDDEAIGRAAANFFAANGDYAAFGFVGARHGLAWSRDRGAFFAKELRRLGRRGVRIFHGGRDWERALAMWLRGLPRPAAVFAANDLCADGVLKAAAGEGIDVPDDLAVLGVDDDPLFCLHTRPSLSSLHPDFEAEGRAAAAALDGLMAGRPVAPMTVVGGKIAVTERTSTAPSSDAGKLVRRADAIIAAKACGGLDADMLAASLGISRRLLDMRFRQINGTTVREAIEGVRLAKVRRLLAESRLTPRQIAKACGYSGEVYLAHVFKRRFGLTMGRFRRDSRI